MDTSGFISRDCVLVGVESSSGPVLNMLTYQGSSLIYEAPSIKMHAVQTPKILIKQQHVLGRTYTSISYDKDRIQNKASKSSSTVSRVFVAAGTCLRSLCLAKELEGQSDSKVVS
jgi:hypothetical protein